MREHTTRSDVYSFGVCLYELLTARLPYDHINNRDQIIFMVGRGLLKPDASLLRPDTPTKLRALLSQCVEYEPDNRVEFDEVSPLVTEYPFITLISGETRTRQSCSKSTQVDQISERFLCLQGSQSWRTSYCDNERR